MNRKPGRTFVEKDFKKNGAILVTVLLITVIIIALVSLMPNQTPQAGDLSRIGVSRSFLFPVAYTDDGNSLKVVNSSLKAAAVDDSVSDALHDFQKEKIYYIRANALYEYDIKQNNRRILVGGGVEDYRILNDRSAIVCLTTAGELNLYDYSAKKVTPLRRCGAVDSIGRLVVPGRSGFLYFAETNREDRTGVLYFSDNEGNSEKIAEAVDLETARISPKDRYITYKSKGDLFVTDIRGKTIANLPAADLVETVRQEQAIEELNDIGTFNQGIEISYTYRRGQGENGGEICYFTGNAFKSISQTVRDVIYYSQTGDRIFFTAASDSGEGRVDLMMSVGGREPERVMRASSAGKFIWCEETGKVFCLDGGDLYRVSVFDDFKQVRLASGVNTLKLYPGKAFPVYTDTLYNNYYILSDNVTDQVAAGASRLYGITNNNYLLKSIYSGIHMSLDLVENESMKRLDSDIERPVCFDSTFENVMYLTWEGLVLRDAQGPHLLDNTKTVSLVRLMG